MDTFGDFGSFGGFGEGGQFSFFPTETKKAEKKTEKKAEKKADGKKSEKKAEKVKQGETLKMPVTVYGLGFKTVIEGDGEITVRQALDKAGADYRYCNLKGAEVTVDGNSIFVNPPYYTGSNNDLAMGESITFSFAGINFDVSAAEINEDDPSGEETTFEQAEEKFLEVYPAFKGATFDFEPKNKVAFPYFKFSEGLEVAEQYQFYTGDGVQTLEGSPEDVKATLLEGMGAGVKVSFAKSETGYYFYSFKGAKHSDVSTGSASSSSGKGKKAKTFYTLPFTIFIERYDEEVAVTAEDFEGREKVDAGDIVARLKKEAGLLDKYPSLTKVLDKSPDQQDLLYLPANERRGALVKVGLTTRTAG